MELKTINFETHPDVESIMEGSKGKVDLRNDIVCFAPTYDVRCYLNYITLLNMYQSEWVSYGYLDMGMVPIVMLPSFFPEDIKDIITMPFTQSGIQVYPMPPVSNMKGSYRGVTNDIWVFREDLAKILNVGYREATLSNFLKMLLRYSKR